MSSVCSNILVRHSGRLPLSYGSTIASTLLLNNISFDECKSLQNATTVNPPIAEHSGAVDIRALLLRDERYKCQQGVECSLI